MESDYEQTAEMVHWTIEGKKEKIRENIQLSFQNSK